MVQAISLAAVAAEQAQQSQPAQPAQPADPAAESLGSNGGTVAVSEAQVAASRFEQAVVAQGVSIAPGILRLGPDDVLAHFSRFGRRIAGCL
jgi:glucose/arabinose dehydrogenase